MNGDVEQEANGAERVAHPNLCWCRGSPVYDHVQDVCVPVAHSPLAQVERHYTGKLWQAAPQICPHSLRMGFLPKISKITVLYIKAAAGAPLAQILSSPALPDLSEQQLAHLSPCLSRSAPPPKAATGTPLELSPAPPNYLEQQLAHLSRSLQHCPTSSSSN